VSHQGEEKFMRRAIAVAQRGIRRGQTPFGACVVKDGRVISSEHNRVWRDGDITAHAEMVAIRRACQKLNTIDLSGCVIYSTCEPCPMCFSACHWARIEQIIFGAGIKDAKQAGFNELFVSNVIMKKQGKSPVKIVRGFLAAEAKELFKQWQEHKGHKVY